MTNARLIFTILANQEDAVEF